MKYNPLKIEKEWQRKWEEQGLYVVSDFIEGKENEYVLVEFPYPSGNLHVGHWYAFSVPDIYVRARRMQGRNVLYPIGFDAFGLPAENAAIKRGLNPKKWTYDNMEYMRKQIRSMGASFDTSREVVTCNPNYYRWTQWLFLQLFKNNLVVQKGTEVNWCSSCKTVLANEQVVNNQCERCGMEVEQKKMKQWNIRITEYADRLINDLDVLAWPKEIKDQQKNWIGRSEGTEVIFKLRNDNQELEMGVAVFTTRVDTIFGCTYVVLAPEHKLIMKLKLRIANQKEVEEYIKQAKKKTTLQRIHSGKEKTGIELKGIRAVNPFNGEAVPVYVADYVLGSYGTGAVMAVPAHDERDWEFAKKYDLPIRESVIREIGERKEQSNRRKTVYGIITNESKEILLQYLQKIDRYMLPGGGIEEKESEIDGLMREIREETGYVDLEVVKRVGSVSARYISTKGENRINNATIYVLQILSDKKIDTNLDKGEKEMGISHFWVSLQEAQDKIRLNPISDCVLSELLRRYKQGDYCFIQDGALVDSGDFTGLTSEEAREKMGEWLEETGNGKRTTQYKLRDWTVSRQRYWGVPIPIVHCEKCGEVAVPDDQLPVELPEITDYLPREDGKSPLAKARKWAEVKCPKCGADSERETDTLDTFVCSSWYYLRYLDSKNDRTFSSLEKQKQWMPVNLYSGGAEHVTMHLLYSRFFYKALYDLGLVTKEEPYIHRMNRGLILGPDGNKMSKSKGNVIDPDDVVREFGADSMRLYLAFIGPYNTVGAYPWSTEGVSGVRRFLDRVWRLQEKITTDDQRPTTGHGVEHLLHKTIKKVTEDIEGFRFNTAISSLMILVNRLEKEPSLLITHYSLLTLLLSPFAPHIAEELWEKMGHTTSIFLEQWPAWYEELIVDETVTLVVQVNGKVRDTLAVPSDIDEARAKELALESEKVQKFIAGKAIRKVIFVKGKLVNIVI